MAEHITIGETAPRIQYIASGTDGAFTYPFPIFRDSDIAVYLDTAQIGGGYAVLGAGRSEGGTVVFDSPPPAGAVITLRRALGLGRVTDFQENGELRASVLNDELDFQAAALQQVAETAARAIQLDPTDTAPAPMLPPRAARASRLVGFDAGGAMMLYPTIDAGQAPGFQQQGAGAVARSAQDKLSEVLTVRDFGATGDGSSDDRAAIQAAFTVAGQLGRMVLVPEGNHAVSGPLTLPATAAGLIMHGRIVYSGTAAVTVLTLGGGGAGAAQGRVWQGIRVVRASQSNWANESDLGVLLRTPNDCAIDVAEAAGFTIGVRVLADGAPATATTLTLGRIANNRIGLDLRSASAAGLISGLRIQGGRFAVAPGLNEASERFGIRLSAATGANRGHDRLVFEAPSFALAPPGGSAGIPFLVEVDSRGVSARDIRIDGASSIVARHTAAAEDHVYDVAWAAEPGPVGIAYTAAATRAGGAVLARAGATPNLALQREVAAVPCLRAAAFRWAPGLIGFDQLACLDGAAAAPPATLREAARPGLGGYTLGAHSVSLGPDRGLGFVVDTRACRTLGIAYEGDPALLVVQCFDAAGALLGEASGTLVRASAQALTFNAARGWWQGNAEMSEAGRTRFQAVRLSPIVATAIIGLVRGTADVELHAMRLYADPRACPALLAGLPDLPHGHREIRAEAAWDPPSLVVNASAALSVAVPGAALGDVVSVGFTTASPNVVMMGTVTSADTVSVVAWNRGSVATDLAGGTLRLRVAKT